MRLRVRELREGKGWNQTTLGYHAGLSPSQVSQIENGKRNATLDTLEGIATALGVGVGDLFPKAEAPPEHEDGLGRRAPEEVWRAEYLARAEEMLAKWEGEVGERVALADSEPIRFFDWLEQLREIGRPHMMGVVAGYTATTDGHELEAVLGSAEYLGRWRDLWHRIERITALSKDDERRLRKIAEEASVEVGG